MTDAPFCNKTIVIGDCGRLRTLAGDAFEHHRRARHQIGLGRGFVPCLRTHPLGKIVCTLRSGLSHVGHPPKTGHVLGHTQRIGQKRVSLKFGFLLKGIYLTPYLSHCGAAYRWGISCVNILVIVRRN